MIRLHTLLAATARLTQACYWPMPESQTSAVRESTDGHLLPAIQLPRPAQTPIKASELPKTDYNGRYQPGSLTPNEIRLVCGPSSSDGSSIVWSDDSEGSDSADDDVWEIQSRLLRETLDHRQVTYLRVHCAKF